MPIRMECCPAFNYAMSKHETSIIPDDSILDASLASSPKSPGSPTSADQPMSSPQLKAVFQSDGLSLDLRYVSECQGDVAAAPVELELLDLSERGHLGLGVCSDLNLVEGQVVTFVLRTPPESGPPPSARPTRQRAKQLGVPMQSTLLFDLLGIGAT